jgi:hypothetical protein
MFIIVERKRVITAISLYYRRPATIDTLHTSAEYSPYTVCDYISTVLDRCADTLSKAGRERYYLSQRYAVIAPRLVVFLGVPQTIPIANRTSEP